MRKSCHLLVRTRTSPHRLATPLKVILGCACGQALRKSDCKALTFIHLERQIPSYNISRETFLLRCTQRYIPHASILSILSLSWGWGGNQARLHYRNGLKKVSGCHRQLWPLPWPEKDRRRGLFLPLASSCLTEWG